MAGFDDFDGFKDDDFNFDSSEDSGFNFGGSSDDMRSSDDGDDDLFSDGDEEDLDLEDTSGTQLRSNAGTEESDEAANRIKKVAFFGIGIAIAIIVIICIIVRISAGVKAKENSTSKNTNTQDVRTEQIYNNSNNTAVGDQNAQAQSSVGTGWIEISDTNWEFTSQKQEGTMSVTSVHVYANYNTTAGEAQLKTVVIGGISGLAGTYELDLPVELTGLVNLGTKLQVEYDMTTDSNGDIIVGNISIKE